MRDMVHFIPIVTFLMALGFSWELVRRFRSRPGSLHLLWWAIGVATYAAGTLTESLTTLLGWHDSVFRAWYITGALMGGAPLAQGTVYLLLPRRRAHLLTGLLLAAIVTAGSCVLLSPIRYDMVEPYRLSGRVLEWGWVRLFSPFINLYAVTFLIGGAIYSAIRYWRLKETHHRAIGNVWIAVGALLPGIGGAFTRFGHTEVLYVTELLGLVAIYVGYRLAVSQPALTPAHSAPGSGAGEGSSSSSPVSGGSSLAASAP
jgi:hypothetical protein